MSVVWFKELMKRTGLEASGEWKAEEGDETYGILWKVSAADGGTHRSVGEFCDPRKGGAR